MKKLPRSSLDSYQTGARAVRVKSLGALALGATALAALPSEADAQITASSPLAPPATISTSGSHYLFLDLQDAIFPAGNSGHPYLAARSNFSDGVWVYAGGFTNSGGIYSWASINTNDAEKFSAGSVINGSSTFIAKPYLNEQYGGVVSSWISASGYLGFKATLGDGTHYGWAKITTNADASNVTLTAIGFNTVPGQSINAGQTAIPEPASSAALLALGAVGLAAYRKRKNLQRAA